MTHDLEQADFAAEPGRQLALAVRAYQATLTDPDYWSGERADRERLQLETEKAFQELVRLSHQILGDV